MELNNLHVAPIEGTSEELLARLEREEWYLPALEKMAEYRRREWLAVRVLLKEALGEEKEIRYLPSGKPYLADHSFRIGISHTKGYVAIVLDPVRNVAVDIEQISQRVKKIEERFISEEEKHQLSPENEILHLLIHWSAKESLFKLLSDRAENFIEFKEDLRIAAFTPQTGSWGTFEARYLPDETAPPYQVHYLATGQYVLTAVASPGEK